MAYDSKNDVVILFGGFWSSAPTIGAETWAYDYNSNTWENKTPSVSPPGRDAQGMVYDSQSERIIMFGGRSGRDWGRFQDTWTYDYSTNTWTNVTPDISPVARWFHNMVYDTHADRVILFGGYEDWDIHGEDAVKGDTWEFNLESETWTELTPTVSPSPRAYVSMAYDIENQRTILYGGSFGCGGGTEEQVDVLKRDTWDYNYETNTWTNMTSITSPGLRMRHSMVYCSESDQIVMYGGQLDHEMNDFNNETWTYTYPTTTTTPTTPTTTEQPQDLTLVYLAIGSATVLVVIVIIILRRR
jgi:N-acetylneuraminic acid mutarotase